MVLKESILYLLDNSGVSVVKCIHIFSGFTKKIGKLGDIIKVSIRGRYSFNKEIKNKIYFGIILQTKKGVRRLNGHFLRFDSNKILLLTNDYNPIGSRILSPIVSEVKFKNLNKIVALAFCLI